jgi:hypothetical protein
MAITNRDLCEAADEVRRMLSARPELVEQMVAEIRRLWEAYEPGQHEEGSLKGE